MAELETQHLKANLGLRIKSQTDNVQEVYFELLSRKRSELKKEKIAGQSDLLNVPFEERFEILDKAIRLGTIEELERQDGLDAMRERMHEAAEVAEKAGVGTGGRGSQND